MHKKIFIAFSLCSISLWSYAADVTSIGGMANQLLGSFTAIGKLITGGSYIAGLGFSIGAIMKFKQHKDNPTQIPVGTPVSLIFVAAALLYFPTMLKTVGTSMFGTGAKTAGPTGISSF